MGQGLRLEVNTLSSYVYWDICESSAVMACRACGEIHSEVKVSTLLLRHVLFSVTFYGPSVSSALKCGFVKAAFRQRHRFRGQLCVCPSISTVVPDAAGTSSPLSAGGELALLCTQLFKLHPVTFPCWWMCNIYSSFETFTLV